MRDSRRFTADVPRLEPRSRSEQEAHDGQKKQLLERQRGNERERLERERQRTAAAEANVPTPDSRRQTWEHHRRRAYDWKTQVEMRLRSALDSATRATERRTCDGETTDPCPSR
jgi:hypothetical protein